MDNLTWRSAKLVIRLSKFEHCKNTLVFVLKRSFNPFWLLITFSVPPFKNYDYDADNFVNVL